MLKVIQISITMLPDVHQSIIVPLRQNLMCVESCDIENIPVFLNSALMSWVILIQFFLSHNYSICPLQITSKWSPEDHTIVIEVLSVNCVPLVALI